MVLTKADDFPIHQTPEPIAYSGTDRNFYDRYFFNGYGPGGEDFFAVAFGVYPHLNIADAHVSIHRGGAQRCIHASRVIHMERLDLEVGPIRIEVLEPLRRLKVTLAPTEGLAAEMVFEGRAFPIEEPRFIHRIGPRTLMDYTRLTQNGRWIGWTEVDGERRPLPAVCVGTRDRSWGVRPIGARDPQPAAASGPQGFFWQWTPLNFVDRSVFFHFNADGTGHPFNTRAAIMPDGGTAADAREAHGTMDVDLLAGTRHAKAARLQVGDLAVTFEPVEIFLMRGIGYAHPEWSHGTFKGELAVEREDIALEGLDRASPLNAHIQEICRLRLEGPGVSQAGMGVFEQLAFGAYPPLGFT